MPNKKSKKKPKKKTEASTFNQVPDNVERSSETVNSFEEWEDEPEIDILPILELAGETNQLFL